MSTDSMGRIVGTVTSLKTGASVPSALLSLLPLKGGAPRASSDRAIGQFWNILLRALPPGGYVLTATSIEEGETQLLAHVAPGGSSFFDVVLPPSGYEVAARMNQLEQLSEARDRWRVNEPIAYQFTLSSECFCFLSREPWVVEVQPDTVFLLNAVPGRPTQVPTDFAGMERIFAWIEAEIRDPSRSVEVRYNRRLGYPERIHFDTLELLTDSWQTITIRSVREVRQRE